MDRVNFAVEATPSGYLMKTASGAISGTGHRSSLDFWNPKFDKGDNVTCLYSYEDVVRILSVIRLCDRNILEDTIDDTLDCLTEQNQNLIEELKNGS